MAAKESITGLLKEFRSFAIRANAVDLAIGVAIGSAFTAVVQSIVSGLFTPLIAAIFGQASFASLSVTINGSRILYGAVINAVVTLLIVAATLFFLVVKPINALKRRLGHEATSPTLTPCPACCTPINSAAVRCPSCTQKLSEDWSRVP
jgi:large conductance mechanosensitive channel